jgi:hypothetical protein
LWLVAGGQMHAVLVCSLFASVSGADMKGFHSSSVVKSAVLNNVLSLRKMFPLSTFMTDRPSSVFISGTTDVISVSCRIGVYSGFARNFILVPIDPK